MVTPPISCVDVSFIDISYWYVYICMQVHLRIYFKSTWYIPGISLIIISKLFIHVQILQTTQEEKSVIIQGVSSRQVKILTQVK